MAARTAPPKSPGGGRSSPVLTAGTFLILIYMKIDLFRNVSDFRNLFRDGQSPHCILRVFITSCRANSTNVLYQCYISLHGRVTLVSKSVD